MAGVIWTEPALQELDEIADYISLDNPDAAKNLVRNIFNRVDLLEMYPLSGKILVDFETSLYREIVLPPCRIFYRPTAENVYIIHIIREEQRLHFDILESR
ncbi:MAG: type II toxin-antitoxin system RelE/ParE family toxin [Balneolales bacterium]|nr:type II toxin-antitoxin system RelE/ParE family toxin [Balneolales bacterium]